MFGLAPPHAHGDRHHATASERSADLLITSAVRHRSPDRPRSTTRRPRSPPVATAEATVGAESLAARTPMPDPESTTRRARPAGASSEPAGNNLEAQQSDRDREHTLATRFRATCAQLWWGDHAGAASPSSRPGSTSPPPAPWPLLRATMRRSPTGCRASPTTACSSSTAASRQATDCWRQSGSAPAYHTGLRMQPVK
jgi:hypothetical protein